MAKKKICLGAGLFLALFSENIGEVYALDQIQQSDANILPAQKNSKALKVANATGFTVDASDSEESRKAAQAQLAARIAQIAEITGTSAILKDIRDIQGQLQTGENTTERAALINRLIYQRSKLVQYLQTASFEVNSVKADVELAIAKVDDARAQIVEKRARALKRNSVINFVSGGVTKMVGYSLAIANSDLPTNLLEILDGGIQSSLSGMAVREQEEEKHFNQSVPTLLLTIINDTNDQSHNYPHQVWNYLSSRAFNGEEIITESTQKLGGDTTGGETRRGKLLAAWTSSGMIARHEAPHVKGVHPPMARVGQGKSLTAQLLEDRAAMLSDLKSVVSQMNNNLMQLSESIKVSYLQDPTI